MFFKKRKRKQIQNPNVTIVRWIMFGFLAIGLATNYKKTHTLFGKQTTSQIKQSLETAAPSVSIDLTNIEDLLPTKTQLTSIKDLEPGEGEPAVCGQKVTLAYTATTLDQTPINDSADKDKPLTFTIGDGHAMQALEQGVVGMKKGGKRLIFAPASAAYDDKGFTRDDVPPKTRVAFTVQLLNVTPPLPDLTASPFHISDLQQGVGHTILCGMTAKVHFTVWDIEGKKIFSTLDSKTPLTFTTGKSEVFLGLDQGVIGMNASAKRSLVVPPSFQKTMNGNAPEMIIPFPPKQTVLVDVETLP